MACLNWNQSQEQKMCPVFVPYLKGTPCTTYAYWTSARLRCSFFCWMQLYNGYRFYNFFCFIIFLYNFVCKAKKHQQINSKSFRFFFCPFIYVFCGEKIRQIWQKISFVSFQTKNVTGDFPPTGHQIFVFHSDAVFF